ncbi:MAG: queuosine precursor transporter [Saprospiraceae bacterium]|nr:queuosine precursor transporter [Saprospiraceae bacterium]
MKLTTDINTHKQTRLFLLLGAFFIANALIAEFMGVKVFSLEKTLGWIPVDWSLFGQQSLSFNLSAGVLLWPVVFVLTDVINEYFGLKGVRLLSNMAIILILYAFVFLYFAINLSPADFWPTSHILPDLSAADQDALREKVGDYDYAFRLIFGQGLWIIAGSLVAFLVGQILDVYVFHRIKKLTGEKSIWLRATGSTLISQLIDSFIVLFIAFYLGAGWSMSLVLAIGLMNYAYKVFMAIVLTPVIYLAHYLIDRYLGKETADRMKLEAAQASKGSA